MKIIRLIRSIKLAQHLNWPCHVVDPGLACFLTPKLRHLPSLDQQQRNSLTSMQMEALPKGIADSSAACTVAQVSTAVFIASSDI